MIAGIGTDLVGNTIYSLKNVDAGGLPNCWSVVYHFNFNMEQIWHS